MQDNPYSGFINFFRTESRGQVPAAYFFGTVASLDPFRVSVGGKEQMANDLLRNAALGELHAGDTVFLIPLENSQKFLILCKVVGV